MSEQQIKATTLAVKLNEYFGTDFSVENIAKMRKKKTIPCVDVRTPGTQQPRWKYYFEEVKEAIEKNGFKGQL